MQRMRPMSEAPRDGTAVLLWWKIQRVAPNVCYWDAEGGWLLDATKEIAGSETWTDENFAGWTPIVRPLEPEAPEPEAQTMPPTPQRLRLQIQSAAQESVALGQGVGEFLAMAEMAHGEATERAARVGR